MEWFWSIVVGTVFITRDYCQRAIGHWCIAAMAVAGGLSYWMADPFIALASVCAFAFAEIADWVVYSLTKRKFEDRILISSAVATPIDTLIFLGIINLLSPSLIALQIVSKMMAAIVIFGMLKWRKSYTS
jgi:ABC-type enterochelin transport system permease subunit